MGGLNFPRASQVVPEVKNPPADAGDTRDLGSIPESERCPGEGHGTQIFLLGESYGQRNLSESECVSHSVMSDSL